MNAQTLRSPVLGGVHLAARPARPHAGPRHGLAAAPPGAARRSGTPAQAAHRPSPAPEEPPAPAPRPSPPTAQPRRPAGLLGALPGGAGPLALGAGLLGASGVDFSGPGGTLSALAVLAAVVGVHEAGHFTAARLQNIHVTKFAIGFGPALLKFTRGPVEYSLRAFPLGGFVAFPDDDPDSPFPEDDPDLLRNRPVLDRMLVTVAGVAANVAFAYALCVTQAATVGIVDPVYLPGVRIGPINPGTVAERAGIRRGDLLLRVGGLEVAPAPGSVDAVVGLITRNPGKELEVEVRRDGAPLALRVTPAEMPDGTGRIGVSLGPNVRVDRQKAAGVGQALALGAKDFRAVAGTVLTGERGAHRHWRAAWQRQRPLFPSAHAAPISRPSLPCAGCLRNGPHVF
jgi:hypothetical protein